MPPLGGQAVPPSPRCSPSIRGSPPTGWVAMLRAGEQDRQPGERKGMDARCVRSGGGRAARQGVAVRKEFGVKVRLCAREERQGQLPPAKAGGLQLQDRAAIGRLTAARRDRV